MKTITIDLSNVESTKDILGRFQEYFDFNFSPTNWDSFLDSFRCLDSESKTFKKEFPNEKHIHLILKNMHHVKRAFEKDYFSLLEILAMTTDKAERYDDLKFTFELLNDRDN